MAAKPQMTVRLAPSILHALEYIAEREGIAPAELARTLITAGAQTSLDRHGWRVDCQAGYMAWLERRAQADRAAGHPENMTGDGPGDIEIEDIDVADHGESDAPHGASATAPALFEDASLGRRPIFSKLEEADRLLRQMTPAGRKNRSR